MICDFLSNMCGKQFKSQKTLTQYNRDVHIEDDIPCSLCDKTFRTKKHLAYHKLSKHTEKESLQCDVISHDTECSYQTTDVSNFNAHKDANTKRSCKTTKNDGTFACICDSLACFSVLCFHVPLQTIANKETK